MKRSNSRYAGVRDLLLATWVTLWSACGVIVFKVTNALGHPGRKAAEAGDALTEDLRTLSGPVTKIPVVGDDLHAPIDRLADAAARVAQAGRDQAHAMEHLAYLLAGLTIGLPVLVAVLIWLPQRIRFARRAAATQKFLDTGVGLDLFALRAIANQPLNKLLKISDDPLTAWRTGDTATIAQLASLELRSTATP
ncbi:hypothetical protein ACI2LF_35485 [Kribbella sp. NPDC020789]